MAKLWRTKDGRVFPIEQMSEEHLRNAIRFLERAHASYRDTMMTSYPVFNGEMAQFYADQEWTAAMSSTVEDMFPVYEDLRLEYRKRLAAPGLKPVPVVPVREMSDVALADALVKAMQRAARAGITVEQAYTRYTELEKEATRRMKRKSKRR